MIQVIQPSSFKNIPLELNLKDILTDKIVKSLVCNNQTKRIFWILSKVKIAIHSWFCLLLVSARLHENVKPINQNISFHISWPMIRRYGDHLTNQRPVSDSPRDHSGGQLDRDVCCVLELMLAPALLHGLEFPNNNSTIGQQQQSGSLRLGLNIKK